MERLGLIWGFDFVGAEARAVSEADLLDDRPREGFRWLHFNLADQRTQRWLTQGAVLPPRVRELMDVAERRPRAVVEGDAAGFVLEDIERDFVDKETRVGLVRIGLTPSLMVTARLHPLRSGDIVRNQIGAGAPIDGPAAALGLQLDAMADVLHNLILELDAQVQEIEDDVLKDRRPPDARVFITLRSLMARLHRLFTATRAVFHHVELDRTFPAGVTDRIVKAGPRLGALDAELLTIQSQLRLLRDELDLQATQRTNQNLYVLSVMTALMLPATLVTGLFGMNTGGLPLARSSGGTMTATLLAVGASAAVYLGLRLMGFIRR